MRDMNRILHNHKWLERNFQNILEEAITENGNFSCPVEHKLRGLIRNASAENMIDSYVLLELCDKRLLRECKRSVFPRSQNALTCLYLHHASDHHPLGLNPY